MRCTPLLYDLKITITFPINFNPSLSYFLSSIIQRQSKIVYTRQLHDPMEICIKTYIDKLDIIDSMVFIDFISSL